MTGYKWGTYEVTAELIAKYINENHPVLRDADIRMGSDFGTVWVDIDASAHNIFHIPPIPDNVPDALNVVIGNECKRLAKYIIERALAEINKEVGERPQRSVFGKTVVPMRYVDDEVLLCSFKTAEYIWAHAPPNQDFVYTKSPLPFRV